MIAANRPVALFAAVVLMLLAFYAAWTGLVQLQEKRVAVQTVRRNATASHLSIAAMLPPGEIYRAGTRDIAAEAFRLRLLEYAVDRRLLVEHVTIEPAAGDASAAIVARVSVSGPEAAVLQYASALERSRPLIRFTDWRLQPTAAGDGTIRIDGHASALWAGR